MIAKLMFAASGSCSGSASMVPVLERVAVHAFRPCLALLSLVLGRRSSPLGLVFLCGNACRQWQCQWQCCGSGMHTGSATLHARQLLSAAVRSSFTCCGGAEPRWRRYRSSETGSGKVRLSCRRLSESRSGSPQTLHRSQLSDMSRVWTLAGPCAGAQWMLPESHLHVAVSLQTSYRCGPGSSCVTHRSSFMNLRISSVRCSQELSERYLSWALGPLVFRNRKK